MLTTLLFFPNCKIKDLEYEDLEYSFNLNTFAPAMIMKHFIPQMKSKNFGRIVNLTSEHHLTVQKVFQCIVPQSITINAFTRSAAKDKKF